MHLSRLLIILSILLASCHGDIEKNITTDLQVEGNEIFNITLALDESLAFAFRTFERYSNADTTAILGCPDILVDKDQKKVTLEFLGNRQCINEINLSRAGKIHLQFINQGTFNAVVMEYENYTVREKTIQGKREFRQPRVSNSLNSNTRIETFEDLMVIDKNNSSSRINGEFEHRLTMQSSVVTEIISSGSLQGRNITGRPINMTRTQPKRYSITCLEGGFFIPWQGSETWQVVRHTNQATTHQAIFEREIECLSILNLTLHDGRTITYRQ
ncbi:hypothetical protein [Mongoliibacter sp.]|uniref:hypothetical protein n=1 Tax=Mongoliibacter sp. TaxID=2022438 RepID=UPI0026009FFF|nr:hypothetical protein [Mongoliibacter sp.]